MSDQKFKVKIVKCCNESQKNIREKLNKYMGITKLQSFFPILCNYFDFYNGSKCEFTLKTRYRIKDIEDKIDFKVDDSYIKNFFNCDILEVANKKETLSKVFVKELPLLNVVHYLTNEYKLENACLPNYYYSETQKKINNPNNSAYIDVFFSYLGSSLTERGKCPTFPLFYGTFSGIKQDFKIDISEDYDDLCENDDFKNGLGINYTIEEFEIEKDPIVNEELLQRECIVDADSIENILSDSIFDEDNCSNDNVLQHCGEAGILSDCLCDDGCNNPNCVSIEDSINTVEHLDCEDDDNGKADSVCETDDEVDENKELNVDKSDNNLEGEWEDITDSETELSNCEEGEDIDRRICELTDLDLSDIRVLGSDCSMSDISASSNNSDILKYVHIPDFPIQLNMIETLDCTLDNYIDNSIDKKITPTEWKSILFQVCFGLAVAQKHFLFVHNDLHSSNIMFKKTEKEFLYFKFRDNYYRIPTFNKISKIIDFGRATFKLGDKIYFSDVFKKNEDAFGQYTYPYNNSLKNCRIKPNMSFDLSRLATTIMERFENSDDRYDEIRNLLNLWVTDRHGNNLSELDEDFDLYKIIAKSVKSANPKSQLNKKLWKEFLVEENEIPKTEFVYKY
tara:strand:+ start:97 stop:1965 length:1869 start_codon:yes stop_codon:yes gene_type:complete